MKRGRSNIGPVLEKRKKVCPEGASCPYVHEYQHDLEYSHPEKPQQGQKQEPTFVPFSGKGRVLGTASQGRKQGGREAINRKAIPHSSIAQSSSRGSHSDDIECGICGKRLRVDTVEQHMQGHSGQVNRPIQTDIAVKDDTIVDLTQSPSPLIKKIKNIHSAGIHNTSSSSCFVKIDNELIYCGQCDSVVQNVNACTCCK